MIKVIKVDGTSEEYNEQKIAESASRVGVPKDLQADMLAEIRSKLFDGIRTSDIFDIIQKYLEGHGAPHLSAKYNLKESLSKLGPSGYPFEKFVSALLSAEGYVTKINQLIEGKCVSHEVDVVAVKDGKTYFIEAKFHKNPSQRTDVRVALYIFGRFIDISENHNGNGSISPWIVTNTRFSSDALKFAKGREIKVTSWGYPKGEGIMDLIEKTKLHPITILPSLAEEDVRRLTSVGIVTCRDFLVDERAKELLPAERLTSARAIAAKICLD